MFINYKFFILFFIIICLKLTLSQVNTMKVNFSNFEDMRPYNPNTIFGRVSAGVTVTYKNETRVAVMDESFGLAVVIFVDFLTWSLLLVPMLDMHMWLILLELMFVTLLTRVLLNATVLAECHPEYYAITLVETVWRYCMHWSHNPVKWH